MVCSKDNWYCGEAPQTGDSWTVNPYVMFIKFHALVLQILKEAVLDFPVPIQPLSLCELNYGEVVLISLFYYYSTLYQRMCKSSGLVNQCYESYSTLGVRQVFIPDKTHIHYHQYYRNQVLPTLTNQYQSLSFGYVLDQ